MKIKTISALGAALAVMLSAYGIAQSLGAAPKAGGTGDPYDDKVLEQIGLNSKQLLAYYELREKVHRDSEEMYKLPTMDAKKKRGLEINRALHVGMKKIFTPAQYDMYMYLWSDEPFKKNGNTPPPGAKTIPNFGKSEESIVASLGLTKEQKRAYDVLAAQLQKENQELYSLWENTDGSTIGEKSSSINRHWNDGLKKVFTPAQYAEYKRQWDAVMSPFMGNKNPYIRLRPVGRGNKPPV